MRFTITHQIDATSVQKATALRDKCATYLAQEATVLNSTLAKDTRPFKVRGVDVKTTKPFDRTVEAQTSSDAQAQVESKTMVVAAVDPVT